MRHLTFIYVFKIFSLTVLMLLQYLFEVLARQNDAWYTAMIRYISPNKKNYK